MAYNALIQPIIPTAGTILLYKLIRLYTNKPVKGLNTSTILLRI